MNQIKILHEPTEKEPFIVVDKPLGLPSAPITKDDKNNAFYLAAQIFPEVMEVCGKKEIEHGLIHRLDTQTSGLLMIAANQNFYDYIIQQQKIGKVIKTYCAECEIITDNARKLSGYPENIPQISKKMIIESYFRPYGKGRKEVRPVDESSGKAAIEKTGKATLYKTTINVIRKDDKSAVVECRIENGFRHQVRSHLSWCGLPVKGDGIYNSNCLNNCEESLKFTATKIEFFLPDGKKIVISKE